MLMPIIGFLIGFKGKKGTLKWVPIILNFFFNLLNNSYISTCLWDWRKIVSSEYLEI